MVFWVLYADLGFFDDCFDGVSVQQTVCQCIAVPSYTYLPFSFSHEHSCASEAFFGSEIVGQERNAAFTKAKFLKPLCAPAPHCKPPKLQNRREQSR